MEQGIRNFTFFNPTKILFGKGRIEEIDHHIPKDAKVLILYGGGSIKKNGAYDRVRASLKDREVGEFSGIEPNPTFETLMKAVERVKSENFTYLLAVGGGSVIDGTKFVAAAAKFPGNPIDMFTGGIGKGLPITDAVPFATVLTLPATASEMNSGGVITFVQLQAKISFSSRVTFPQFSVLEPELTYTLPKRQLVNGIIDTFVHTMEAYLTYPVDAKLQDRYAEGILQTLIEIAPVVCDEEHVDYAARANFMWTATNALNGYIGVGVPQDWATHALGHEITLLHGIDHARTLSIVLPAMMKIRKKEKWDKIRQYGVRVWNLSGSDEEIIDQAILKTEEFFHSLGAPIRFSDVGLEESCIAPLVESLIRHKKIHISERGDLEETIASAIYRTAL